jgi:CubicO group peptidase (beta-lactamase class C family)
VPGVSIGLIVGGKEYIAGLGVTSITNPLPVTPETIFQIGSTTKTFTATAMLCLMEQGKLALDDRVRKYLPDFKVADENAAAGVTIRHLLNHTCGWLGDFFPETGNGDDAIARYVALMHDLPQRTPVGMYYSYNNAALVVAGRIIEVVFGKPYETAVRELVLEPLEMNNSFFFPGEVMLRRFAVGHILDGENLVVADPWPIIRAGNPAGGVASDVVDQLRYMRFHMGDGTAPNGQRLLSAESMQTMQTSMVPCGDGDWVGLTWTVEEIDGVRFYSHGGTTNGQESDFWISPEKRIALTVLTNLDKGDLIHKALRVWVREHFMGLVRQLPVPIHLPEERLADYTAVFFTSTGDTLEICPYESQILITHVLGRKLEPDEPPGDAIAPMRADFFAQDRFLVLDPPFKNAQGEFLRSSDGEIAWMRLGGRIFPRKR